MLDRYLLSLVMAHHVILQLAQGSDLLVERGGRADGLDELGGGTLHHRRYLLSIVRLMIYAAVLETNNRRVRQQGFELPLKCQGRCRARRATENPQTSQQQQQLLRSLHRSPSRAPSPSTPSSSVALACLTHPASAHRRRQCAGRSRKIGVLVCSSRNISATPSTVCASSPPHVHPDLSLALSLARHLAQHLLPHPAACIPLCTFLDYVQGEPALHVAARTCPFAVAEACLPCAARRLATTT